VSVGASSEDWVARGVAIAAAAGTIVTAVVDYLVYRRGGERVAVESYLREMTDGEAQEDAELVAAKRQRVRQTVEARGEDAGWLDERPFGGGKPDKRVVVIRVMNQGPATVFVRGVRLYRRLGIGFRRPLWAVDVSRPPDRGDAAIQSGNDCEWFLTNSRLELPVSLDNTGTSAQFSVRVDLASGHRRRKRIMATLASGT
jgi:hypothetical protein